MSPLLLLDGTRAVPVAGFALDLDLAPLHFLGLRNAKHQHTVVEVRVDVLGVDALGQRDAELEPPDAARAPAELPFALFDFPGHPQLVAVELDVDVLSLDAGQLRL